MKLKVGDKVRVMSGKDKGKEGKITHTFKSENKVIVEGINLVKKHVKPDNANKTTNSRICIHKSESIFHTPYIFEYCIILTIF